MEHIKEFKKREIKFRAFDKESSTMIYPKDYSHDEFYLEICNGEPFLMVAPNDFSDDGYGFPQAVKDAEIMQFTGLTDSLGKECWEGDKVQNSLSHHNGFVKYFDEFAIFAVADENGNGKWIASLSAFAGDGFKITGNIWEEE